MELAPDRPHPANRRSGRRGLVAVLAVAAALRTWGTFENEVKFVDEWIHVPSAVSLLEVGSPKAGNWAHPPLHGLILEGTISVFGDRPLGWRIGNVVLGVGTVLLLYLVASTLYPGTAVPLVAAALLALDPFHALYSRTAYMEVPLAFFFLLFLHLLLEHTERRRAVLPWAGLALGLTIATKSNYAPCIVLALGYALHRSRPWNDRPLPRVLDLVLALGVLPVSIYLLSFVQWFGRGHTLPELVQMRVDAAWTLASFTPSSFMFPDLLEAGGSPRQWFLAPGSLGLQLFGDGRTGRFLLEIGNAPVRLLVLPSLLLACAAGWRRRDVRELRVPALFVASYLPPLLLARPVFGHSALVVLPFAYVLVARALGLATERVAARGRIHAAFLAGVIVWGLYAFPLYAGIAVPLSLYSPLLSTTHLLGPHP
jgi:dolichyl-phosphate-mannose--protein O-mannosyl transferase